MIYDFFNNFYNQFSFVYLNYDLKLLLVDIPTFILNLVVLYILYKFMFKGLIKGVKCK